MSCSSDPCSLEVKNLHLNFCPIWEAHLPTDSWCWPLSLPVGRGALALLRSDSSVVAFSSESFSSAVQGNLAFLTVWSRLPKPLELNHFFFYSYWQGLWLGHKALLLIYISSLKEKKLISSMGEERRKSCKLYLGKRLSSAAHVFTFLSTWSWHWHCLLCIITWVKIEEGADNNGNVFGTHQQHWSTGKSCNCLHIKKYGRWWW